MSQLVEYSSIKQSVALSIIGLVMTVGVYGFVALIVRADDMGLWMMKKPNQLVKKFGLNIINFMPYFMRFLTVVRTLAMFLVGGTIISHHIHFLHELTDFIINYWTNILYFHSIIETFIYLVFGFIYGSIAVALSKLK